MARLADPAAPRPPMPVSGAPEVITEPLGGGALARAALEGRAPAGWYVPVPSDAAGWRRHAEAVRGSVAADAVDRLMPAIAPAGPAAERLGRAARGGILVTTGQQPGLFGGPVYTWTKALSALALADALEEATGLPVAPLFWAATDDADFAEAASTVVALPGGARTLAMEATAPDETPMAEVPLPDLSAQLELLERASGSAAFPPAIDAAREAYRAGETVGSAYVRLLRTLLEPLGIAVLDASHPALAAAARPLLVRALEHGPALDHALAARDRELAAAGHEAQVPLVKGLSLVHAVRGGARRRVPLRDAAAVAADAGARLGATVLLRPVVERALLPTAAYVAGPGEIAYFAQVGPVAETLGAAPPLVVPRWSATIVEPHVARILERLGVTREELAAPDVVETRLARAALPGALRTALDALRASAVQGIDAVERAAAALAMNPEVYAGARRQLEARVARLERRHVAAQKRASEAMRLDIATARAALHPEGKRQERALNFLPLLARHGPALLERMRARAREHARALVGR